MKRHNDYDYKYFYTFAKIYVIDIINYNRSNILEKSFETTFKMLNTVKKSNLSTIIKTLFRKYLIYKFKILEKYLK